MQAEGAFTLSNQLTDNTYAELVEVALHNDVTAFLRRHGLTLNDISLVLTGIPETHYAERPIYKKTFRRVLYSFCFWTMVGLSIFKTSAASLFAQHSLSLSSTYYLLTPTRIPDFLVWCY